jgi:phosphoesterase RecJ-like protein
MKSLNNFIPQLESPKNIAITHHYNADADALGSTLGLRFFLEKLGHKVTLISPNENPSYLSWLPGTEDIIVYETTPEKVESILTESDVLFCLDFNIFHRTKNLANSLENFSGTKILIDHHLQPDEASFDFGNSVPEKSSTAEMIFDFINLCKKADLIDQKMASCLYIGAVADTGGFKYASTAPSTLEMAAELMRTGINISRIQERTFNTRTEGDLRLLGYILKDNMQLFPEHNAALITITPSIYKKYNIQSGGTEGLVNYPLSIGNIIFSTFIVERDGEVKMSLRSQGTLDVSNIARTYFNGGGHKNASGGKSNQSLDETIKTFKDVLDKHKKEINLCYNELQQSSH